MNDSQRRPIRLEDLPWYLSPYFIGAVLGVTVLTLLRPCTRYVPEPIPVVGNAPAWMAEAVPTTPSIAVTTYYEADCEVCRTTVAGLATVSRQLSWVQGSAEFVILHPPDTSLDAIAPLYAYEPDWRTVAVAIPALWRTEALASSTIIDIPSEWPEYRDGGWIWILERSGAVRGPLQALDGRGIDEVFHRVQHVQRAVSEGEGDAP